MKFINEINTLFGTSYEIYINDCFIKTICFIRVNKEYEGYNYLFLIHKDGYIIEESYSFLNIEYKNYSLNTREQLLTSLKILYSFAEIINKDFESFDKDDINLLSNFIQGKNIQGNSSCFNFTTERSIPTHNIYFSGIRSYFKYLGIKNETVFEKKHIAIEKGRFGMMGHTKKVHVEKYRINKNRHQSFTVYVPKYIKLDEYYKIINFIDNQYKNYLLRLRNRIIIDLMYCKGLRIGEVLGLTQEDLIIHPDNNDCYIIILRNRLSDKPDQKAKTCYQPKCKSDYESSEYNKVDTGYQKIIVLKDLKDMIDEYIRLSTNVVRNSEKVLDNILQYAVADSVNDNRSINQYIFLNKNGTPLRSTGWNKELKSIFKGVGINYDKKKKKYNLNHRFRHGFAMLLLKNGYSLDEIKYYLRHFNISSTFIYTKPEEEETIKKAEQIDSLRFSKKTSKSI